MSTVAMAIPVQVKIKDECSIESVHVSNKMMPMSHLRNKQYRWKQVIHLMQVLLANRTKTAVPYVDNQMWSCIRIIEHIIMCYHILISDHSSIEYHWFWISYHIGSNGSHINRLYSPRKITLHLVSCSADRTALSMIGYWHDAVVCLSDRLSVHLWRSI